ncbi:inositol monophosphatase [Corynebacterium sp.]|uniref:inositol monophosphatase family protein n=1 Tax=Corynebacterium sp. TaxID=1720 RepID=UPI0026DCD5AB|nr:inositol monophosphatase [Corynebacterium sp.]MDO4609194.1 inositol monophosphatase [Corynebacterium sp.]
MGTTAPDPLEMLAVAERAVAEVEDLFRDNLGAAPTVRKPDGSCVTAIDMAVEERLRDRLTTATGLPFHGEESGGGDPARSTVWIVDPVDGTTNYANGHTACAILVSLVHEGRPIASVTSLPIARIRVTAAEGHGVRRNGEPSRPRRQRGVPVPVGFGSVIAGREGRFPRAWRRGLLTSVGERLPAIRISGSVGYDLAMTATGTYGGAVTFSPNIWDNAAGVLAVRESGGVVTDLAGRDWTLDSVGVLAGTPAVHEQLLEAIGDVAPPSVLRGRT